MGAAGPSRAAPGGATPRVLLVGYEDQDNLGLRYLSGQLRASGHRVRIVTVDGGAEPILRAASALRPQLVGFSLIFQYMVPQFAELIAALRAGGLRAHFTMGGHYASFEYASLLERIPELDSVVRFEGEDALVELSERVAQRRPWHDVAGIAFRGPDGPCASATRVGRSDLDTLPWPDRDDIAYEAQGLPTASVLGSRGCPWRCSFCSIITFYEHNGTKGRRRRDPVRIVDEIEHLHRERGVRVILWQDDDFLAGGRAAIRWVHAIARECIARGLHHGLRWKFSCRSNEVRLATLEPLVEAGLTHVYLGVEAGDPRDLAHLNKLMSPDAHFAALEVIRSLDLSFDFGFMLLNPWSTVDTARGNLRFLREFAGEGESVVGFCRMLPYVGTEAERRLRAEGRLLDRDLRADYCFLDPRLDTYYEWFLEAFAERNAGAGGTQNLLRLLQFEAHLRLPGQSCDPSYRDALRCLTAMDNHNAIDILEDALDYFEQGAGATPADLRPQALARRQQQHDAMLRRDLANLLRRRPDCAELLHATR